MTRRSSITLLALVVLAVAAGAPAFAHPGDEHKVLGTVTMAASDHVMVKGTDGKVLTIYITKDTRVLRDKKPVKVEDIKVGMRVIVTAVTEMLKNTERMMAKTIELGVVAATK